jgi:hypothetical protein
VGKVGWTLRWKRDNIFFGLFYGIGKEREEGGVMGGYVYVCVSGGILWSYRGRDGYTLRSILCLYGRIIGVGGLEVCPVFGVFLCLGGVLKPSVCEGGQVRLFVFGSVQVGEGSFCPCL